MPAIELAVTTLIALACPTAVSIRVGVIPQDFAPEPGLSTREWAIAKRRPFRCPQCGVAVQAE